MKKPRAIVHIGTMKTGTTSIQQVFDRRRADMLAQGAYYPKSPGTRAHELLTYAAAGGERGPRPGDPFWKGADQQARLAEFRQEFAAEMQGLPPNVDRVILSDERFSFYLRTHAHIAALRAILEPHFEGFTVIAYLRSQDSFLASRYAEQLRVGAVGEPDHRREHVERLQDYDYRWLLNGWSAVFGEPAIKPRIYERGTKGGFDSVSDFMAACGVDLAVSPDDRGARSNPSMNLAGQQVLREVGRLIQEKTKARSVGGPLWRQVSDAVTAALPGKGWLPTREEAVEFMARFRDSNEEVRRRFFPERGTLFADETGSFPAAPVAISDEERFQAACLALLELATRSLKREGAGKRAGADPSPLVPADRVAKPEQAVGEAGERKRQVRAPRVA